MKEYLRVVYQLITMGHLITDEVNRAMKEFGMTEPQYNVLKILWAAKGKPLTVQQVQQGMVQQGSNVTRIIDKLQSKSLVERKECLSNRRKMDLTLTKKGAKTLEKLDQQVNRLHYPRVKNLSKRELTQLTKLLIKFKGG